jgi:hypothetical protein
VPPTPTMGWVIGSNGVTIPAEFGDQPLERSRTGLSPAVALDGAGAIDGPALSGGIPSGQTLSFYRLKSGDEATLLNGTTVLLLCGRENHWLVNSDDMPLPVEAPARWNVSKPGEWGLSLASPVSQFAVSVNREWVYANPAPPPAHFLAFGGQKEFPPNGTNAPVCVWGLYDASFKGKKTQPEISAAYDDGPASAPVKVSPGISDWRVPVTVRFNYVGADISTLFVWQGEAAERLFQQSVRADYWNDGLRKSIASGFTTHGWYGFNITSLDPRPIALGGDAQDNVWAEAFQHFVRTSPFAHYSVTTSPGTPFLALEYRLGNLAEPPNEYSVSFSLDGQYFGYDQPWRFGTILHSIPLPQDGRSHTLDLRNGFARSDEFGNPTEYLFGGGGFIDAVAVPRGYQVTVNHPVPESVALVLSHSVAVGEGAATAPYLDQGVQSSVAWPVLARAAGAFGTESVVDESYGGQLLASDCLSPTACAAYIATIKAAQPAVAVGFVARMLNDFYHGPVVYGECLPQYEQALQNLFAAWSSEFPGVPLYVGSDMRESAALEAETDGCTPALQLADWRAGIESTVNEYAGSNNATWLQFVDMTQWVPQADMQGDGIHPTTKGQVEMCQAVASYFNQPVTCSVPQ